MLPAPKPVETVVAVKPVESVIEVAEAPAAANEDGADAASPPLDVEADPAPHAADVTEKEDEVQASPALQVEEPVEEAAESLMAPEELETPPRLSLRSFRNPRPSRRHWRAANASACAARSSSSVRSRTPYFARRN